MITVKPVNRHKTPDDLMLGLNNILLKHNEAHYYLAGSSEELVNEVINLYRSAGWICERCTNGDKEYIHIKPEEQESNTQLPTNLLLSIFKKFL